MITITSTRPSLNRDRKPQARLAPVLAALAAMISACSPDSMARPPMGAHFEKTGTVMTDTFETGPRGGTFTVPARGAPTDRVTLDLPEKAVDEPVRLAVGYCTGDTKLAAGIPSRVVLVVDVTPEMRLEQPLKITVSFPPDDRYTALVGFAIDANGRFRPIDLVELDLKNGRASFLTFRPLTFTWAYIER